MGAPRIAVDAMGGDNAPGEIVAGAVKAAASGIHVLLVGRGDEIAKALADCGGATSPTLELVEASDVIAMDDPDPARAIRSRRDSSIGVACRLVKQGRADGVFSAGATGAALAGAVLEIGRIRGVARPAIAVVLPFDPSPTVLLDAGANADIRPEHMVGFSVLGATFASLRLGIEDPRVGLLSVGEEPGKGNDLTKAAYSQLERAPVRFVGNVEGRDIPGSDVDVVVADGFVGNVVLKLLEGFGRYLFDQLMGIFTATEEAKAASKVVMDDLLGLASTLSPQTHGGAHLLGVKGVCIIGHGSSNSQAVEAALRVASETVEAGLTERITERLASLPGAVGKGDAG